MSTIYNISPGFLQIYETYQGKAKLDPEEIFKRLSFEMGGDGKTITKKQLDSYIDKAKSGKISVDKNKLNALKQIQKNWDTIAGDKDSITYSDMGPYKALLLATVTGTFTETEIGDNTNPSIQDAIMDYLTDSLGLSDKKDITKFDLTSYLNELIQNSSDEDNNSELIDNLTNIIATYSDPSTVEAEV